MLFTTTVGAAGDPAGSARFDNPAPAREPRSLPDPLGGWARALSGWPRLGHRISRLRAPPQAVLLDADGVWAWSAGDRYAPATRLLDFSAWLHAHPDRDVSIWLSTTLLQDRESDLSVPAFDVDVLRRRSLEHRVRMRAVAPWWRHAAAEARRCVPQLDRAAHGEVVVVEGPQVTRVMIEHGALRGIQRLTLAEPSMAALHGAIGVDKADAFDALTVRVVVGQGIVDGNDTGALPALVLGRLDGRQPPQWLRPFAAGDF